ncbi:MAG: hypothetical protein D3916_08090, partial [Candidatus Electrothrix sp. MAN1_4]|nr:hypothetical protein [Candidatus Electrothrix sp. MAN1_4]
MSFKTSLTGYERLHTILVSLGMEITDSILSALHNEVAACRQEQKDQLVIVEPILLGIETVGRHIDEIRPLADARALQLLNDLVQAYQMITEELSGQQQACQAVMSKALKKVLNWQHSCIRDGLQNARQATAVVPPVLPPVLPRMVPSMEMAGKTKPSSLESLDMKALLATVQQEITATGMLAIRESAALLELVHVQKEAASKAKQADR